MSDESERSNDDQEASDESRTSILRFMLRHDLIFRQTQQAA